MNKEKLERIKSAGKYFIENFDYFKKNGEDLLFEGESEDFDDFDVMHFCFPGENDSRPIDVSYVLDIMDELPSLKIINNGRVKTIRRTCQVVSVRDHDQEHAIRYYHDLKVILPNGTTLDIIEDSFFIGLTATKLGAFDTHWGVMSPYIVLEVDYGNAQNVLSDQDEEALITSYLFEVADSCNVAVSFAEIQFPFGDINEWEAQMEKAKVNGLKGIEVYNAVMSVFISAVQIDEPDLKLLNFYKVLEYFAPIVVNIEANELLRKKLDLYRYQQVDGDYINSIFEIGKTYSNKFRDEDLVRATFDKCFDFVGLFNMLPESIIQRVKKEIKVNKIDSSLDLLKLQTAINMVARAIYATRNQVVHSKSNFDVNGSECPSKDIVQLNVFMKKAASQAIRWYNRLPEHLKREVVSRG
ncbi:hypothetical protein ACFQT0_19020 [Hymenobacter humi]|uniref:Apea-like HEPN domain-containing protein n=1 Tax=Hymenobacter humi TaxID=1411620 RepID=A0ABW2U8M2_9BACT